MPCPSRPYPLLLGNAVTALLIKTHFVIAIDKNNKKEWISLPAVPCLPLLSGVSVSTGPYYGNRSCAPVVQQHDMQQLKSVLIHLP